MSVLVVDAEALLTRERSCTTPSLSLVAPYDPVPSGSMKAQRVEGDVLRYLVFSDGLVLNARKIEVTDKSTVLCLSYWDIAYADVAVKYCYIIEGLVR